MNTQTGAHPGARNSTIWARIAEHCGIAAAGTIAAYLLTVLPQLDFGKNTAIIALVASAVLKWICETIKRN